MEQYDVEFETINEILYNKYTDSELNTLDVIFKNTVGQEILELIETKKDDLQSESKIIANNNINEFYNRIFNIKCPRILKFNINIQQLYVLHVFSLSFIRFNKSILNLDDNTFLRDLYLPNIYYLCAKSLILAKKTLYKIIKDCYSKIESDSSKIIEFYSLLYKCNSEIIKNQILNIFFCNTLSRINPLDLENVEEIYKDIIYRLFFYYIKTKTSKTIESNYITSNKEKNIEGKSERYYIYEKAIYLSHIENMCNASDMTIQVSSHFDKIKNIVLPNELQKLFLLYQMKNISINAKVSILNTCASLDKIEKFKNYIPLIYRILRSIHVDDKTVTNIYDTQLIYVSIFNSLQKKFKNIISEEALIPFVEKVSSNLANSLTSGKYIDMVTLTEVNTTGTKFCEQLQKFLDLILVNIEET